MAIPVAIAYSPKTQTSGITAIGADVIVIDNTVNEGLDSFPAASVAAPGVAVLCTQEHFHSEDPADYETITYTSKDAGTNELRGVTRNVEGTAREWPDGTWIASYTSAAAWNEMRDEIFKRFEPITTNMTVNIPTDYATLQAAIDALSQYPVKQGVTITINIETAHTPTSGIVVENGDYSHMTITSDDAEVALPAGFTDIDIMRCNNAHAPKMKVLFDATASGAVRGFVYIYNSRGLIGANSGVKNLQLDAGAPDASGTGLFVWQNSHVQGEVSGANGIFFTGNKVRNVHIAVASSLGCDNGNFSNAADSHNVFVSRGSNVYMGGVIATGAGDNGLEARRSRVTATPTNRDCDFSNAAGSGISVSEGSVFSGSLRSTFRTKANNCGSHAVLVTSGSTADIQGIQILDSGARGIEVSYGSTVNARDCVITDPAGHGIYAVYAANVSARGCDISGSGDIGVFVVYGSVVDIEGGSVATSASRSIRGLRDGHISAYSAFAIKHVDGVTTSTDDISVADGSIVSAVGATGGVSQTANTITVNGIIFK